MFPVEQRRQNLMISTLGFRYLETPLIGFQQTTESYARYERLRHQGWDHRTAISAMLYGNPYATTYLGV